MIGRATCDGIAAIVAAPSALRTGAVGTCARLVAGGMAGSLDARTGDGRGANMGLPGNGALPLSGGPSSTERTDGTGIVGRGGGAYVCKTVVCAVARAVVASASDGLAGLPRSLLRLESEDDVAGAR